ncbi:MAG: transcriptional regulator [Actinomycetota bacterium]|nr:transcriptional regulator [Actinomycetota bacterium]
MVGDNAHEDGSGTSERERDAAHRLTDDDGPEDSYDQTFTLAVGQRLRAIRQARGMSLADVEDRSNGQWSASAVGAYERGFRNLSLPRLHALAQYYNVPVSVLLGEPHPVSTPPDRRKIVLDLEALRAIDASAPIRRFVQSIIEARGDFNGRVLSLRFDDLKALCTLVGGDIPTGVAQLRTWGVMVEGPEIPESPALF